MMSAIRRRWRLVTKISMRRWAMFIEALILLCAARLIVALCLARIAPWAFAVRHPRDRRPSRELELWIGRAVEGWVNLLRMRDCCLIEALAVRMMLARRGFPATIHLGAGRRSSGDLHAHAWIEAGGQIIVGERAVRSVTPFLREPRRG